MSITVFTLTLFCVLAASAVIGILLNRALDKRFMDLYFTTSTLTSDASVDGPLPDPSIPLSGSGSEGH